MTNMTLKTLFAGGGMLATWLAVTPNDGVPVSPSRATIERTAVTREATAEELNAQAARLRDHLDAVPLRPTARNPFRFAAPRSRESARAGQDRVPPAVAERALAASPEPGLTLVGVAETNTPDGPRRTAIISGEGQLFLLSEGESLDGRYVVVTIGPDAMMLRDQAGVELRLVLR